MARKKTKPTLKQTADVLAAIAEKHLNAMPEEEREKRMAAVALGNLLPLVVKLPGLHGMKVFVGAGRLAEVVN